MMTKKTTPDNLPVSPDGGRAGCIVVFAMWTDMLMWFWILKGMGIMLPTIQYQFDTKTWVIGWITCIMLAIAGFAGNYLL